MLMSLVVVFPFLVIYIIDIQIWATVFNCFTGGITGALRKIGRVRSWNNLRKAFHGFFVSKTPDTLLADVVRPARSRTRSVRRHRVNAPEESSLIEDDVAGIAFPDVHSK
jgi:hypothetical protein